MLERLGYEVNALDLPGSGHDLTAAKDVSLDLCIHRTVQVVESGTSPVLLVGHSMAGIIISGVGEAVPQKIGKLVYVAAFLLRSGETVVGLKRTSSGASAARAIRPSEIEGAFDLDRSMVPDIFYNCCEQEVAARATARLRAQAIGPLTSSSILTEARWGMTPKPTLSAHGTALYLRRSNTPFANVYPASRNSSWIPITRRSILTHRASLKFSIRKPERLREEPDNGYLARL